MCREERLVLQADKLVSSYARAAIDIMLVDAMLRRTREADAIPVAHRWMRSPERSKAAPRERCIPSAHMPKILVKSYRARVCCGLTLDQGFAPAAAHSVVMTAGGRAQEAVPCNR